MGDTTDARVALLKGLFDYAGLFPPAALTMERAVAEYLRHKNGPEGWMVGPFVCPARRLNELAGMAGPDMSKWRVAVVIDYTDPEWVANFRAAVGAGEVFTARTGARINQYETAIHTGEAMRSAIDLAARAVGDSTVYFEVGETEEHRLYTIMDSLAKERDNFGPKVRVKIRTGGPGVPQPSALATLISAVLDHDLRAKVTAGLHSPFRRSEAHGFVNVSMAFLLGGDRTALTAILSDTDPNSFVLTHEGLGWRGRMLATEDVAYRRFTRFSGIGTCSVEEPVEHLIALGVVGSDSLG
ncbi:MAG: hypothetical protein OEO77_13965 [Acidimicrobiia bacterium]|nr:hypothetical protein [Acidimicrobiia bacterium]